MSPPHRRRSAVAHAVASFSAAVLLVGLPSAARAAGTDPAWLPPLETKLQIIRTFSLPNGPYRAGHRGIDLTATVGDPVRAPASGVVTFVGVVVDRPVVSLRVDQRTLISFEPVRSALTAGTEVFGGDPLGQLETGDHCPSACLHMGVRVDERYVHPLRFLRPRPQLLPWG